MKHFQSKNLFGLHVVPKQFIAESQEKILLGGFSGLTLAENNDHQLRFWTVTDRGPNLEMYQDGELSKRPFLIPQFQPRIVELILDKETLGLEIGKQILLTDENSRPMSGLPPKLGNMLVETPVDNNGQILNWNENGMDSESIACDEDGNFWIGEEYRPGIFQFDSNGKLLARYVPEGLNSNSETQNLVNILPSEYRDREINKGFESLSYRDHKIFAILEAPLKIANASKSRIMRLVVVDIDSRKLSAEYLFEMKTEFGKKINDLAFHPDGNLYFVQQNSHTGADSIHKVIKLSFADATNILPLKSKWQNLPEKMDMELLQKEIQFARTEVALDLVAQGFGEFEKVEGLSFVDSNTLAVINDNDFGIKDDQLIDKPSVLGILKFTPFNK